MGVDARPFADPRNTYWVDNNDPTAFDKSFAGTIGVHKEQRCCSDRAPQLGRSTYGFGFVSRPGQTVVGSGNNGVIVEELWCQECKTALENTWETNFVPTFDAMVPVVRGIAMAVSYIPVFGTAVSFSINVSVSLAQGENITNAVLDGIGGALPGQPVSGMAFNTARALISGKSIDLVLIAALPIDENLKTVVAAAIRIAKSIAQGESLTNIALDQIYTMLPDEGKRYMTVARQLIDGQPISDIIVNQLGDAAMHAMKETANQVKAKGDEAVRSFIAQSGYQAALDVLPDDLKKAIGAAVIAGVIDRVNNDRLYALYPPPGSFAIAETNTTDHDTLAKQGQAIEKTGVYWKAPGGPTLLSIRNGKTWTYPHTAINGVTLNGTVENIVTDTIDDAWRRGFDIAVALFDGAKTSTPEKDKIALSMGAAQASRGFEAGKKAQFDRSNYKFGQIKLVGTANLSKVETMVALVARLGASGTQDFRDKAATGAIMAQQNQVVALSRSSNDNPEFRWGFDIGSAVNRGNSITGPGSNTYRLKLGPNYRDSSSIGSAGSEIAQHGFDVAQAIQFGLTKAAQQGLPISGNPNVAAGQLAVTGIVGSGTGGDQKSNVIQTVTGGNPGAAAGAAAAIIEHESLWHRFWKFFGIDL